MSTSPPEAKAQSDSREAASMRLAVLYAAVAFVAFSATVAIDLLPLAALAVAGVLGVLQSVSQHFVRTGKHYWPFMAPISVGVYVFFVGRYVDTMEDWLLVLQFASLQIFAASACRVAGSMMRKRTASKGHCE